MTPTLHRFQYSTTTTFALELGSDDGGGYMRFFAGGQPILSGGDPYTIIAPWAEADLAEVQMHQLRDVAYFTHGDYETYKLVRLADDDWTLEPVAWTQPPMLDANITTTTITPSATTGTITLDASDDLWEAAHVGSYWRIGHKRAAHTEPMAITGNGNGTAFEIFGPWELRTYGNWGATVILERSTDGGTVYESVRQWTGFITAGVGSRNVSSEGTAETNALYRVRIANFDSAGTDAKVVLEAPQAVVFGIVKITDVDDATNADAVVISELYATTATTEWAEGAWSGVRGYARTVASHEQRLLFGGTFYQPNGTWGSATDDFENFEGGTDADDSWAFELAGAELNLIMWMCSANVLLIGTSGGEWRMRGNSAGDPITPSRVDAKQLSQYGSAPIPAVRAGTAVLFVERKAKHVREIVYTQDVDQLEAPDLTLLSEHVARSGVVKMAWQADTRIMWCVMNDGTCAALTYNREEQVVGWHRHVTDGDFLSVTTVYGPDDTTDEAWFVVERTNGKMIERLHPQTWEADGAVKADAFHVDSGLSYNGSPNTAFGGADHLAGLTCVALADGVPIHGVAVDDNGDFVLDEPASKVHIGLEYVPVLSPFRLDSDQLLGIHLGKTKRVVALTLRLRTTLGLTCTVDPEGEDEEDKPVEFPDGGVPANPPLFTGDLPVDFSSAHEFDPRVIIKQPEPLPFILVAMVVGYTVSSS